MGNPQSSDKEKQPLKTGKADEGKENHEKKKAEENPAVPQTAVDNYKESGKPEEE